MEALFDAASRIFNGGGLNDMGGATLIEGTTMHMAARRAESMGIHTQDFSRRCGDAIQQIRATYQDCESPIERRLLPALVFADYGEKFASFPAHIHNPAIDKTPPSADLVIIPQFAFIRYRLDFVVLGRAVNADRWVGVECDGEDYHCGEFKERLRDAYLEVFGIKIIRLKGADIYRDPAECAQRVAQELLSWRDGQG